MISNPIRLHATVIWSWLALFTYWILSYTYICTQNRPILKCYVVQNLSKLESSFWAPSKCSELKFRIMGKGNIRALVFSRFYEISYDKGSLFGLIDMEATFCSLNISIKFLMWADYVVLRTFVSNASVLVSSHLLILSFNEF